MKLANVKTLGLLRHPELTLNVDGPVVRIAEVERDTPTAWASAPLSPQSMRGDIVVDPERFGEDLRAIIEDRGFHKARVSIAASAVGSMMRLIALPPVERSKLPAVVDGEARRLLAYSPETSYLFWQPVSDRNPSRKAFLATVPKAPLDNLILAVQSAGLQVAAVDLRPLAVARAANRAEAVVAYLGRESLDIILLQEGIPVLVRTVSMGTSPIMEDTMQSILVDELARTLSFYDDSHPEAPMELNVPIYLTGESLQHGQIDEEVESMTGHPIAAVHCPIVTVPGLSLDTYIVNIGLMLKGHP